MQTPSNTLITCNQSLSQPLAPTKLQDTAFTLLSSERHRGRSRESSSPLSLSLWSQLQPCRAPKAAVEATVATVAATTEIVATFVVSLHPADYLLRLR
ncbi:hypothetical protein ACSBR1_043847 [Camellia fascicularis]